MGNENSWNIKDEYLFSILTYNFEESSKDIDKRIFDEESYVKYKFSVNNLEKIIRVTRKDLDIVKIR